MNLAAVYSALFDKSGELRHLDDALDAVDWALETLKEYLKVGAAFYIKNAERIRGEILAAKGKL
jgi:hypothetical protein